MSTKPDANATGLSDKIALHVERVRFDDLSANVVEKTKWSLLDAIGVSLAASGLSPEVRPFVELAQASGGAEEATILGFGGRTSAAFAALANGAMAHAVDYEDSYDVNPCHPNASLIPAALAVAEWRGGVSGQALLTSLAVGCDLVCRLAISLRQTMEESGWYPPPILGAFGAAAGTAKLLDLDAVQIKDAVSLMLCQATCSGEIKHSARTEIRAVREAFPAQAAVLSAQLAARGVAGFETPFEGHSGFFRLYVDGHYDEDALTGGLGRKFYGEDVSFKPWPSCRGTHAYVEACFALKREHDFLWTDIDAIKLTGGEVHQMLVEPRSQKVAPSTIIDAKFSLPFTVAKALIEDSITLDSFTPASLKNSDVISLASRVTFELCREWGRDRGASAEVEIRLRSGETFGRTVAFARGHPRNPMSAGQLIEKFVDCARRAARPLDPAFAAQLADRILNIENEPDVAAVLSALG